MSIPTWTYDADFYKHLAQGHPFDIQTDEVKGKGLFATRALGRGEVALVETAMCCTQNVDECVRRVPCCAMCLVSLESPRGLVARATKNKSFASELPYLQAYNVRKRTPVGCKYAECGCSLMFCSYRCREAAWNAFHFAGCRGRFDEDGQAAYDTFTTNSWQQAGIDYSDTHFLAFRFFCTAITRHRLHGKPLPEAYAQIEQLIKAPISMFNFTFLLSETEAEIPADLSDEDKRKARWERFQNFKKDASVDPAVISATEDGRVTKDAMVDEGMSLLNRMFKFNKEEAEFFSPIKWSELLGAVLLNGQERMPNSPYVEYCEVVNAIDGGKSLKAYEKVAQDKGYDLSGCSASTKGQGIYPIGCLFNHSCSPNLQVQYTGENDESLVAISLRDIEPGEELCISYIDESMPFYERQQQLFEHYLFDCCCVKCKDEKPSA